MEEQIEEKIMDLTKTSFTISNIPVPLFKWFKQFCLNNTGDSYSMGIAQLKMYCDFFNAYYPNIENILIKLEELESELNKLKENKITKQETTKKPITFGSS